MNPPPGSQDFYTITNREIYLKLLTIERDQSELRSDFKSEQRILKTLFGVLSLIVMPLISASIGLLFT